MASKPLLLFLAILLLSPVMFFTPAVARRLQAEEAKEQLTAKSVEEDKKVCYYYRGHRVCHPPAAKPEMHFLGEEKKVCYFIRGERICHPPAAP